MYKAWVLTDSRTGNSNQAISLANLLNLNYKEIKLKYNILGFLPLLEGFKSIKKSCKEEILSSQLPEIIISCGRRASKVALSLKKLKPKLKIIQILRPDNNAKQFNLILLPKHDKKRYLSYSKNYLFFEGAIANFDLKKLEQEKAKWSANFSHLPPHYVTVLVGGNSKKCNFDDNAITIFIQELINFYKYFNCSFLITTSRRTPKELESKLIENLNINRIPYFFYSPHHATGKDNPLLAMLAAAERIIVTGDSISMCTESCSLNKPVYIFYTNEMVSKKHKTFIEGLFQRNHALSLDKASVKPSFKFKPLNFELVETIKTYLENTHE